MEPVDILGHYSHFLALFLEFLLQGGDGEVTIVRLAAGNYLSTVVVKL